MPLSETQESHLKDALDLCDYYEDRLTEWEFGFIYGDKSSRDKGFTPIKEQYEERGAEIWLSPNQWVHINKIKDRLEGLDV